MNTDEFDLDFVNELSLFEPSSVSADGGFSWNSMLQDNGFGDKYSFVPNFMMSTKRCESVQSLQSIWTGLPKSSNHAIDDESNDLTFKSGRSRADSISSLGSLPGAGLIDDTYTELCDLASLVNESPVTESFVDEDAEEEEAEDLEMDSYEVAAQDTEDQSGDDLEENLDCEDILVDDEDLDYEDILVGDEDLDCEDILVDDEDIGGSGDPIMTTSPAASRTPYLVGIDIDIDAEDSSEVLTRLHRPHLKARAEAEADFKPPSDDDEEDSSYRPSSSKSRTRLKVTRKKTLRWKLKDAITPTAIDTKLGTTESAFDAYYSIPLSFADTQPVLDIGLHDSDSEKDLPILKALERKWAPNRKRRARKVSGSRKSRNSEGVEESERRVVYVGEGWEELVGDVGGEKDITKRFLFEGQPMAGLLFDSLLMAGIKREQLKLPRENQPCPFKEESGCTYLDKWDKDKNYLRHVVSHLKGLGYFFRCPEDGNLCIRSDNFLRHSWICRGAWILGRKRMYEIYRRNLYVVVMKSKETEEIIAEQAQMKMKKGVLLPEDVYRHERREKLDDLRLLYQQQIHG